jgi:tRNA (Thr-GGU) A37 N-methylase
MSAVRLLGVEGTTLRVAEIDILDGTPLLDIKPYVPDCDAYVGARAGWVDAPHIHKDPLRADDRFSKD